MRFHIGFSHRISIKTILWILGTIFVGLCAFLGITDHQIVYADGVVDTAPSVIYYYRNNSSSRIETCGGGTGSSCGPQTSCSAWGGPCFTAEATAFQSFEPFNMTYEYPAFNLCSGNNYTATINFSFVVQYPRYTLENGNVSVVSPSNARITNFSINSNHVVSFDLTYDTRNSLSLRVNGSSGYVYYSQFRKNNDYTCQYSIQDSTNDIINNNTNNTNSIINNNNQNTQDIIDNQSQNTQDIIDNQNSNNQALIDSQLVCKSSIIDKNNIVSNNYQLLTNGNLVNSTSYGVTDYIQFKGNILKLSTVYSDYASICFYDKDKILLSCSLSSSGDVNTNLSIPSGSVFLRASIHISQNRPTYQVEVCKNQGSAITDELTDDNVSGASSTGSSFFSNFNIDTSRGFSQIATAPIRLLQSILTSSNSCSPLVINFNPSDGTFSGSAVWSIPCGSVLWSKANGTILALWHTIIFGIFGYRILVDMVKFVNNTLNPEYSKEYFMDL